MTLGCCLFAGGVLLCGALWHDYQLTTATERDRLEVQARVVDDYVEQLIGGVNQALQGVRDDLIPGVSPQPQVFKRLKALVDAMPGVQALGILDERGRLQASTANEPAVAEQGLRAFFLSLQAQPDADRLYLSTPYRDAGGVASVWVARALAPGNSQLSGLVYAQLDADFFAVVMRSVLYAPDMHAILASPAGRLFVQYNHPPGTGLTQQTELDHFLVQHLRGTQTSQFLRGMDPASRRDSLVALRTLQPASFTLAPALMVEVNRDAAAVYAPWAQRQWLALSLYGLLVLASCLGLQQIQRQRLARERIQAEQARERRADAERLELALSGAELGLWEYSFPERMRTANARWAQMLGYAPHEIDVSTPLWRDQIHPDDLLMADGALTRHLSGELPSFEAEYRLRHHQGHWVWVLARGRVVERDASGQPVRLLGTHMDTTQRKRVEEGLRESEQRFRSLTELSSDWYWEIDENYRFTRLDGMIESTAGFATQADLGRTRWEIPALNMTEADWDAHRAVLRDRQVFRDLELERVGRQGESLWVAISGAPFFDANGQFLGYRGVGRDITQRKQVEQKIEQLAYFDALTGLPNRRMLTDRLTKALAAVARSRRHGALIFIDLDNFKDLNDTKGHDIGDQLLHQVAARLQVCVRETDTVARLGGDEFVVMLEELSPYAGEAAFQAEAAAKKMLSAINEPFDLQGHFHHSTPSIGIALFHDQLKSVEELLKRADLAMYQAKAAGRNALRFFDPGMQAAASARAILEADLRQGLNRQELRLHYQPVVDESGTAIGVEALVRWQHPQRGSILPGEFIDLAEKTDLIISVGQWVLRSACEQLVIWAAEPSTRDLSIAVNVSARQFRQSDFAQQVLELLRQTGANPYRLKLELTESMLLSDVEDAVEKMRALRAAGVGFSLDDFGTGYSSLAYLKRLPLDQLKIDQSFVRDVLTDPNDAAIVRTILALARSMDLVAVAEGVETEGQYQFLLDNGCWTFQGYRFGRPVPVHELDFAPDEQTR